MLELFAEVEVEVEESVDFESEIVTFVVTSWSDTIVLPWSTLVSVLVKTDSVTSGSSLLAATSWK